MKRSYRIALIGLVLLGGIWTPLRAQCGQCNQYCNFPIPPGSAFYESLAIARDASGDGLRDILLGVGGGGCTGLNQGVVRVRSGSSCLNGTDICGSGTFGSGTDSLGDIDGDGIDDLIVGAPGYPPNDRGAAYIVYSGPSGVTLLDIGTVGSCGDDHFGTSVAGLPDINGDSVADILVGGPSDHTYGCQHQGYARIYSGATRTVLVTLWGSAIGDRFGFSVGTIPDINGDGVTDFWVGAPLADPGGRQNAGQVNVYSGASLQQLCEVQGIVAEERLSRIAAAGDLNGDGRTEVIVGDPFADGPGGTDAGEVRIYSRSPGGVAVLLSSLTGSFAGQLFGRSVEGGVADLDKDGVWEVFTDLTYDGVPELFVGSADGLRSYSGASRQLLFECLGSVPSAIRVAGDLRGAGTQDVVMLDQGIGQCVVVALPGCWISQYCTAKMNSLGCLPAIGWSGCPSMTSPQSFLITATNIVDNKAGIFFYGTSGRNAYTGQCPWNFGGVLCVQPPLSRTPVQNSGGVSWSCGGTFSIDFNAVIQSGINQNLVPGAQVNGEYWYRDPQAPCTTGTTDAIEFTICPR